MLSRTERRVRQAGLLLCGALALHVLDEATTGFLNVYNPTVLAIRAQLPWFPMPLFTFGWWLGGLALLITGLVAATPLIVRSRYGPGFAYFVSAVMLINGVGHIVGTLAGRTVASVHFSRPMPGFYSSPLLLAAAVLLISRLRTRQPVKHPGVGRSRD